MLLPLYIPLGFFDTGAAPPAPAPAPTPTPAKPSGGRPSGWTPSDRKRTRKEISDERKRHGVIDDLAAQEIAAKTIADVAARQAESLEQDQQKQFEELLREIELRGIKWEARYLEALRAQREALIDAEIARRLKQQYEDDAIIIMLIAASL